MRRRPGGPRHAQDAAAPQIERWALARGAGPSVARWGDGRSGWAGGEGVRGWNDRPQRVKWRETRGAALSAALACTLGPLDFWARWLETSANSAIRARCSFVVVFGPCPRSSLPLRLAAQSERVPRRASAPRRADRGTGPRRPKNRQAAEAHPRACCLLSGWSVHGATRGAASLRANDQLPCIQLLSSGRLRARAPTHRTARTLTMPRFAPYRSSQHDRRPRARPEHALRPFDHRRPPHGGTANARLEPLCGRSD